MNRKKILFAALLPFLLGSCIGVNAGIVLNRNGSGTIALEYIVSKSLDSLGRLDGNERWNTIPVGRADFERTIERLPEMRLLSFSSGEDEKNIRINAKLEFSTLNGLVSFLDASGRRSVLSGDARSGRLALILNEGSAPGNSSLNSLIAAVTETYSVRISMTFPGEGRLIVTDLEGSAFATPESRIIPSGKTVSCFFPLYDVLSSPGGVKAEFQW
jgi:hypothetical protein